MTAFAIRRPGARSAPKLAVATRPKTAEGEWPVPVLIGVVVVAAASGVFVAWKAFVLAYAGSKGTAIDIGVPESSAGAYPWCIEGLLIAASVATVVDRRAVFPWLVLLAGTVVSIAANVAHSVDHHAGVHGALFAAWPPLALPACVHLALKVAERLLAALHRQPVQALHSVPAPVADPRVQQLLSEAASLHRQVADLAQRNEAVVHELSALRAALAKRPADKTGPNPTAGPKAGDEEFFTCDVPGGCGRSLKKRAFYLHRAKGCPTKKSAVA